MDSPDGSNSSVETEMNADVVSCANCLHVFHCSGIEGGGKIRCPQCNMPTCERYHHDDCKSESVFSVEAIVEPQTAQVTRSPRQRNNNGSANLHGKTGGMWFLLGTLVFWLILAIAENRGTRSVTRHGLPHQTDASDILKSFDLDQTSDGYDWDKAKYGDRMALCHRFAENLARFPGKRNAYWYYELISAYYERNPQKSLLTIHEVVSLGVTLDSTR